MNSPVRLGIEAGVVGNHDHERVLEHKETTECLFADGNEEADASVERG